MVLSMYCWILFASILLRIFASMVISDIGLQFSFFVTSLSGVGVRVVVAQQNEFGGVPPSNFLEEFKKDRYQLVSKCLTEFACEAIWSWTFVCWKIFIHSFNFSACDWSVQFLFLPSSVSEDCALLRICPFFLGCPFYWHSVACSNLS